MSTKSEQVSCVCTTESRATIGLQDGKDGIYAGGDVLVRENIVLEQGIDRLVMELGTGEGAAKRGIVGPQQGTQLIFLAIDLLGQLTSSPGAETSSEQISVLAQHDLGGAAQTDLFGQSIGIDQVIVYFLGKHPGHMLSGT